MSELHGKEGEVTITLFDGVESTFHVDWTIETTATPIQTFQQVVNRIPWHVRITGYATRGCMHPTFAEWLRLFPRSLKRIGRKINRRKNRSRH